ncbi:leukocyte surface antigen CD47 isoform X2 [Aotus nancymaae]|uniref:leukocyte surface antigen CD47 isoform X2 n=1 Tax=Aotus nancymaae TaxID=37293 RepID=UPI0030FE2EFC
MFTTGNETCLINPDQRMKTLKNQVRKTEENRIGSSRASGRAEYRTPRGKWKLPAGRDPATAQPWAWRPRTRGARRKRRDAPTQGSAQLLFNKTKSVEFTFCNDTVVIPCFVTNMEAQNTTEIYVKWKFKGRDIYTFDGALNRSTVPSGFNSAKIEVSQLLKGDASLKLDKSDAASHTGNYTCEVTELTREGETIVELKYRVVSWFSPNENILIVIFPIFAILLFWGQFGIKTLKYRSGGMDEKTIALLVAGLTITVIVIVGAILFVPGEYSLKNATGLGLIVTSTGILILLHYYVFSTAFGLTSFVIAILVIQVIAYVLAVVGLSLCIAACIPMHGPLLISGLSILALAQLLGLVYMKFVASNHHVSVLEDDTPGVVAPTNV